jgi:hypothetical protein
MIPNRHGLVPDTLVPNVIVTLHFLDGTSAPFGAWSNSTFFRFMQTWHRTYKNEIYVLQIR